MKELIIFDLDGTLAPSKSSIDEEMASLVRELLSKKKVLVMSGGAWRQFEEQFLKHLNLEAKLLSQLFLSPGSGSSMYRFENGEVHEMYADYLSSEEKKKIKDAFDYAIKESGVELPAEHYGDVIEDRGIQMTFSALGQKAPLEKKALWDKDHSKRESMVKFLKERLPELEIHVGGTTSIDITKKGEGKDYGINEISRRLNIPIEKMVYIGDALYPGGNDEPAKLTGVETIQVKDVEETKKAIRDIMSS
jgi:phosphomannomutase